MEWYRRSDGHDLILDGEAPHGRSGCGNITLQQPEIELRPMSRRRVPVIISIPEGVDGESYCSITVERADIQLDASPEGRARRSVMLRISPEGVTRPDMEVQDFTASREPSGAILLRTTYLNTGNVGIDPEVRYSIKNEEGTAIAQVHPQDPPFMVQAGGEGSTFAKFQRVIEPGSYTAEMYLRFAESESPIIQQTPIEILPTVAAKPAPGEEGDAELKNAEPTAPEEENGNGEDDNEGTGEDK
jgi:hypothetical protein